MRDSEILRELIGMAYACENKAGITLSDCLDLYGRLLMQEQKAEQAPAATVRPDTPCPVATPAKSAEGGFTGVGAGEKKAIHAKLKAYREKHGLGCYGPLAKATRGALTDDNIRDMATGLGKFPLKTWQKLDSAIDRMEAQEQKGETDEQKA